MLLAQFPLDVNRAEASLEAIWPTLALDDSAEMLDIVEVMMQRVAADGKLLLDPPSTRSRRSPPSTRRSPTGARST